MNSVTQGQTLYAIDTCTINGVDNLTIGKEYEVKSLDGKQFTVIDDENDTHYFNIFGIEEFFATSYEEFQQHEVFEKYHKQSSTDISSKIKELLIEFQQDLDEENESWEENNQGDYPEGMDINDAKIEVLEKIVNKLKGALK